jgi:hypothetical protein
MSGMSAEITAVPPLFTKAWSPPPQLGGPSGFQLVPMFQSAGPATFH